MAKLDQWGSKNPCWRGGKSTYNCLECGKEFKAYASRRKRGEMKFCSRECGYENKRRRKVVICEQCGKEVEKYVYDIERHNHTFCSRECWGKWKSENLSGENSPLYGTEKTIEHRRKIGEAHKGEKNYQWKGGIKDENTKIRKSFEMGDWRRSVFKRDDYTCQRCLMRGGELHAHHIIPFSVCSEERFKVDNGATLCVTCHYWIHEHELGNHGYHSGDGVLENNGGIA